MAKILGHTLYVNKVECFLKKRSYEKSKLYSDALKERSKGKFCRILPLSKNNGSTDKKLMFGLYVEK